MGLVVQKFGGSSVADCDKIVAAARRIVQAKLAGNQVIAVVSARGKTTDELIGLAHEITDRPPAREMDMLVSTGEQVSVALVAMAIHAMGHDAISFTGAQIGIVTDSYHTKARIRDISADRLRDALGAGRIAIVAGFQGVDVDDNITTLGRGGSDTTAVALAAALKADVCEIYTDVDGVFTADPRIVAGARKVDCVSYDEMLELASVGAGVMHSRSIEFAKKYSVPIHVRHAGTDSPGTMIVAERPEMERVVVCGAAVTKNEARVTLLAVPDRPGVVFQIFREIAARHIAVDMIVQNVSVGGTTEVSFTVPCDELSETVEAAQQAADRVGAGGVAFEEDAAKVSVVGVGMRTHAGVAERMFSTLADHRVNIKMISTSEIKISVLVDRDYADDALRAVHAAFQLDHPDSTRLSADAAGSFTPRPDIPELTSDEGALAAAVEQLTAMEDIVVSAIDADTSESLVTVSGVPDRPGIAGMIFSEVARGAVIVNTIVQNTSTEGTTEVSFTVPNGDLGSALLLAREVADQIGAAGVSSDADIAKLNIYGVGLRSHPGVAARLFGALADQEINIKTITSSEVCLSVVVDRARSDAGLDALRRVFGLTPEPQ